MNHLPPLTGAGLRAFPPEIREMIYTSGDLLAWAGRAPALLVALRGDQGLYREALGHFTKRNTFTLHRKNEWKTGDMAVSSLQSIRRLQVDFWSSEDWEEWDVEQIIEPSTHDFDRHAIMQACNTQTVHFNVSSMSGYNMKACLLPAAVCAVKFPRLERMTVELPKIMYHRSDDPYDSLGLILDLVNDFNHYLGLRGRLVSVGTEGPDVWFWEAEKGKVMAEHVESHDVWI